jgi:ligand-binding sensor domain-containing protein
MKKLVPLVIILILFFTNLSCNLSSSTSTAPSPEEPTSAATLRSTNELVSTEPSVPTESATLKPQIIVETPTDISPTEIQTSGLTTGWYSYVNANVVRDLVIYNGVIHAATLGGLVTWRLDSGYPIKYTPIQGMGHISAYSVVYCEIPDPRILVGTLNGISIYDPNTGLWEQKSLAPAESHIDGGKIERLYCDQPNNRLLIGYNGLGILDLKTGEFQHITKNEGLLWESVTDIVVNGKDIWIASGYKGIAQISGGKVKTFSAADGMPDERAYSLAIAKDGMLWVGASTGIQSFKNGKWTLYGSDSAAKLNDVSELEISLDGKIWATTLPLGIGRLCQFNPQTAACDVDFKEVDNQGIQALTLTDSGIPVYATNKGVYVFENDKVKPFKTDDQLVSNYVDSFASAPDGKLWVGTDSGIHLLDPADPSIKWNTYRQSDYPAMGGNWASWISAAPDGTVWVAIIHGSASRYQNGEWTSYKDVYSFNAVTVDAQGRAWFSDDGKGIIVLNPDGSEAMKLTSAEGLPSDNVQVVLTDLSGRVWIGTDQGLAKYENNELEIVFGKDNKEFPNTYIRALALDSEGSLIIGTFTGVVRYDGNSVDVLVDFLKDGFSEARLTTLAVAPNGRIWVGTDKGLLYSDGAGWKILTTKDGLMTNYISALHVDEFGAVWVGGGGSNFDGGGMLQIVP